MSDLCRLIWSAVFALFRSRAALHAEILFLRHQRNVLHRRSPKRVALSNIDRLVFAGLYCLAPHVLDALKILKPETVIRWHRAGFRAYWRWRSRPHGGRPGTAHETRELIRGMSIANPLWGAPRIHGELLKLGIDVGQTTGAKYMAKPRRPPSEKQRHIPSFGNLQRVRRKKSPARLERAAALSRVCVSCLSPPGESRPSIDRLLFASGFPSANSIAGREARESRLSIDRLSF